MVEKYGCLMWDNGEFCNLDFIIVGYGKVGGIEFSY